LVDGVSSIPLNFAANRLASLQPTPQEGTTGAAQPTSAGDNTSLLAAFSRLSNPNLAAGQTASSVLGATVNNSSLFPEIASEQSQLLQQIAATAQKRFSDAQTQIADAYQQKADTITAQTNQWITVKASINNANASVTQAKKSLSNVNAMLLALRGVISNAEQDAKFNAQSFNTKLSSINLDADRLGRALNLVGSINRVDYSRNTVEYRNDLGTGVTKLQGGYIGSDYRIMAGDGTVWVPDLPSGTLTHYSELQGVAKKVTITEGQNSVQIPETASYQNGIRLVSYNGNTKAITLEITINPSDPPTVVTGTLQQTGIGLMPAWFYDNLATQAGRDLAHKAVNEAIAQTSIGSAQVQAAANRVTSDSQKVDAALSALNSKNTNAKLEQLQQLQDLQTKYVQQVQAMQNNLNQLSSQQQNYIDAFASVISSDPFLSVPI
jgi:hypothetical protein